VELAVSWECAIAFCGLPVALTTLGLFLVYRSCHPESSSCHPESSSCHPESSPCSLEPTPCHAESSPCHPERSERISFYKHIVTPLSEAGYGMYLMHMLVLGTVSAWLRGRLGIGPDGLLGPVWTTPVEILGTALISFVIVGLVAVALRRIPRVGKWIIG
jgi:hypothetical protein